MAGIKVRGRYCISLPGLLKWIQMIFACVVFGLILWEKIKAEDYDHNNTEHYLIKGEQFTLIVCAICVLVNLIFLFIFFLNCHMGPCVSCRCFSFASFYYGLSVLMWLTAGGVEVYAAIEFKNAVSVKVGDVFSFKKPLSGAQYEELFRRRAAAAAFAFANGLLYLVSLQQAKYQDL